MKKTLTLLTAAALSIGFTSCANMTHEQQRAAQGAALGALGGAIIGNQGGHPTQGALIGAAAGGAGGYMYGRNETGR